MANNANKLNLLTWWKKQRGKKSKAKKNVRRKKNIKILKDEVDGKFGTYWRDPNNNNGQIGRKKIVLKRKVIIIIK